MQTVKQLIECKADPYEMIDGDNMLARAVLDDNLSVVRYLIEDVGMDPTKNIYDGSNLLARPSLERVASPIHFSNQ